MRPPSSGAGVLVAPSFDIGSHERGVLMAMVQRIPEKLSVDEALSVLLDLVEAKRLRPGEAVDESGVLWELSDEAYEEVARTGLIFIVNRELNQQRRTGTRHNPMSLEEKAQEFTRALRSKIDAFAVLYQAANGTMQPLSAFGAADIAHLRSRLHETLDNAKRFDSPPAWLSSRSARC